MYKSCMLCVVVDRKPESIVVGYYFCGDPIPYRTVVPTSGLTLGQFKGLMAKKGNFR